MDRNGFCLMGKFSLKEIKMDNVNRGYKIKTIREIIDQKINDWLKSIDWVKFRQVNNIEGDDNTRSADDIKNNIIVTGGCIASMLQGEEANDFDIYFKNKETARQIANYYVSNIHNNNDKIKIEVVDTETSVQIMVKSAGVASENDDNSDYQYFESLPPAQMETFFKNKEFRAEPEKPKYKAQFITSNCISLDGKVQLVLRFVGNAEEIHKNFDYVHTTNYFEYCLNDPKVVLNNAALECILTRELRYIGSRYPICSLFRMKKFLKRGYTITAGEIFKISYDISKLELSNVDVLRDQLTGVDVAYFTQLIQELQNKEGDVDRTYIMELVNRIFND